MIRPLITSAVLVRLVLPQSIRSANLLIQHEFIGFSITTEELYTQATSYITANAISGWSSLSSVIGGLKNTPELRWASPLDLKNTVEKAFVDHFGSKEEALAKLKAEKVKVGNK